MAGGEPGRITGPESAMPAEIMTSRTVVISSTAADFPDHRAQAMEACLRQDMVPKMMEHLPTTDEDAIAASLAMVDKAHIYLGILGFRYGYVPAGHAISITEMEYDRAGERGIPRLMFLMHERHLLTAADVEKGEGAVKLEAFRKRVAATQVVSFFTSPDNLRAEIVQSLSRYRRIPSQADLLRSQIASVNYRIAVINGSATLDDHEVRATVAALQTQVHRDFAPAWGINADLVFVPRSSPPPADSWEVVLLDDPDVPWALGSSDLTATGLPRAKVFTRLAVLTEDGWTLNASHMLLELLANPRFNLTVLRASSNTAGRLYAHSICTPCSGNANSYEIDGVRVSDFVFPAWFETFREPRSARFDQCNRIVEPFEVLPDSYALVCHVQHEGWRTIFREQSTSPARDLAPRKTKKPRAR